jgi:hypothetical protein
LEHFLKEKKFSPQDDMVICPPAGGVWMHTAGRRNAQEGTCRDWLSDPWVRIQFGGQRWVT